MPNSTNINLHNLHETIITWILTHGLKVLLIAGFIILAIKLFNFFTKKLIKLHVNENENSEYYKKIHTLHSIIKNLATILIIAIGTMLILQEIGINVGPILAAAGVLGIAVGFGSQRLVEDVISGIIILINDQIRVGDVVQIGTNSGYVEKLTLNMIVLRDISGNVHFIRTGKVDTIINMTKDFSYYVFDIGIAYQEDIEKVSKILKEIGEDLRNDLVFSADILEPIEILGVDKFNDSTTVIKTRIKTNPIKQWVIGREFNLRLKKKFDESGVKTVSVQRHS